MSDIKTIFIDWNQTLSTSRFWGHLPYPTMKTLFDSLHPHFQNWMLGGQTTEQMMQYAADYSGLDYQFIFNEFKKSCQAMHFVSPEITNLVFRLQKKGIKMVIATENADSFMRWTAPALDLANTFDGILNSWDLKVAKENPIFFEAYLKKNNLTFQQCVLIDDSIRTGPFVEAMGMKYLLVTKDKDLKNHLTDLLALA